MIRAVRNPSRLIFNWFPALWFLLALLMHYLQVVSAVMAVPLSEHPLQAANTSSPRATLQTFMTNADHRGNP